MLGTQLLNQLVPGDVQISGIAIPSAQWGVRYDMDSILLCCFHQTLLKQVGVSFDLQNNWLDFAKTKQVIDELPIEIGYPQIFCISLLHAHLKLFPALFQRLMHPFFIIHIHKWPVQVIKIDVVQLHQPEGLLQLQNRITVNMIEGFSSNKQIFSLASIFGDNCFYCFSQRYFIVVHPRRVDMLAIAKLQSLSQQIRQQRLIGELIRAKADHMQNLLIGQNFSGRSLLFLLPLFLSHNETYISKLQANNRITYC